MIHVSDLPIWFFVNWLLLIVININNICETHIIFIFSSYFSLWVVQFSSVTQLCPTLCDPMNHSMPGLPVHHQLPEFTQTHVHWVGDAIQPSHPLSSPSPLAFSLSNIRVFPNESALHIRFHSKMLLLSSKPTTKLWLAP